MILKKTGNRIFNKYKKKFTISSPIKVNFDKALINKDCIIHQNYEVFFKQNLRTCCLHKST